MQNDKSPEEYLAEMMRLYHASNTPPTPAPETQPTPEIMPPQPEIPEEPTTPTEPIPEMPPEPAPTPPPEEPIPVIPPEMPPESPVEVPPAPGESPIILEKATAEGTEIGWIQVITRSAGNARSLPGVSVIITTGSGSDMKLEHVAVTNESGETEKIALPALAAAMSLDAAEKQQPFITYDVSVYASGYYRQISKNVPVFAGITSRQIFSMIPLPIYPQESPETIVYQNTEPNL